MPVGMRNAAGIQEDGVGHREHGNVRADAQGQRQHGNQRESRRLAQLAQRVAKLVEKCMHYEHP